MKLSASELVAAAKMIPAPQPWTRSGEQHLEWISPLDVNGATAEGSQLRIKVWRDRPDQAVCVLLLHAKPKEKYRPIWRIEWRPISPHTNPNKGPQHLRMIQIQGSHHHPFELNLNKTTGTVRAGNLPIAAPIEPDPPDFSSLLAFAGVELRIMNMGAVSAPPWEGFLL